MVITAWRITSLLNQEVRIPNKLSTTSAIEKQPSTKTPPNPTSGNLQITNTKYLRRKPAATRFLHRARKHGSRQIITTQRKKYRRQLRIPTMKKMDNATYINEFWGDTPFLKSPTSLRLSSFNIHNLGDISELPTLISVSQHYEIDVIGIQELGLDVTQGKVRKDIHEATQHLDLHQVNTYSSSPHGGGLPGNSRCGRDS